MMLTLGHLAQFLLKIDPQKNPARLALYNYLRNFADLNARLTPESIQAFYRLALSTLHWRNEKKTLGESVRTDLETLFAETDESASFQDMRHAHEMQILELELERDREEILRLHLAGDPGIERVRIFGVSDHEIFVLQLKANGSLVAQVFPNLFAIIGGQLKPLGPVTCLEYDQHMELKGGVAQLLQTTLANLISFQMTSGTVKGVVLQGPTFIKSDLIRGPLGQYPDLFYGVKKWERFFIEAHSDPFYHELMGLLEKSIELLRVRHPDSMTLARQTVRKGHMAIKNIFPNDRQLLVLVSELEHRLADQELGAHLRL